MTLSRGILTRRGVLNNLWDALETLIDAHGLMNIIRCLYVTECNS